LEVEKMGFEAAMLIASSALEVARKLVEGTDHGIQDAAELAGKELDSIRAKSDEAIKKLEAGLEEAKNDVKALDGKLDGIVDGIGKKASIGIDQCKKAVDDVQHAVTRAEQAVNSVEDSLKECAEFVEYVAAEVAYEAAKKAGSAVLTLAKAGVQTYNAVDQELLKVWDMILNDMEKLVDVTEVVISGELGKAVKGGVAFDAEIKGTFGGDNFFHFSIKYDHNAVEAFFKSLFDEYVFQYFTLHNAYN
jgi:archaellum component FlaC